MDYFTDVLAMFLCLDRGSTLAVYGGSALLYLLYFIVYFYRDNAQLKVIAPELADS